MSEGFDDGRARTFRPNPDFVKTAVLVDVIDSDVIIELMTPFGVQRMRGPFYAVGEGEQSYGASQREFEAAHVRVGEHRWAKSEPVRAYRTDRSCEVTTTLTGPADDHAESTVGAAPGDWIVRQITGEVIVVRPDEFAARYAVAD